MMREMQSERLSPLGLGTTKAIEKSSQFNGSQQFGQRALLECQAAVDITTLQNLQEIVPRAD